MQQHHLATRIHGRATIAIVFISIILLLGTAGFFYTRSDHYKSHRDFSMALDLQQQGKYAEATALYVKWIPAKADYSTNARQKIKELLLTDAFTKLSAHEMADVLRQIRDIRRVLDEAATAARLYPIANAAITQAKDHDPYSAYLLLNELLLIADQTQPAEFLALKQTLLESLVTQRPNDVAMAIELALLYEKQKKWQEAEAVLLPHKANLGQGEGARLLGQLLASKGLVNDAYSLLKPYTELRLKDYREAEKAYNDLANAKWDLMLKELREGKAPEQFWKVYDKADKATQQQLVNSYLRDRLSAISEVTQRQQRYRQAATIVPVALDLGIVMVGKAQGSSNPDERKHYLQDAESTFLAIQGAVADTPEFQFYLGQVYYWLGKFEEGKQLFEKLLATTQRSYNTLQTIATKLREVGEYTYARSLIEEAYHKTKDPQQRTTAARLRSVMQKDTDDAILWLQRADQNDPEVSVALNNSRGNKAEENGRYDQALQFYRKVVEAYDKLPETNSNLNNAALVYFSIARLTKDPAAKTKGIDMMDKAVSLEQSNSITLYNAASILMMVAVDEVVAGRIYPEKMAMTPALSTLQYLYANQQQKEQLANKLKNTPSFNKAKTYLQKVMVLAPKSTAAFKDLYEIFYFVDSREELENLVQSSMKIDPDIQDSINAANDYYSGKKNKEYLARIDGQIKEGKQRLQRLNKQQDKLTYAMGLSLLASLYMSQSELAVNNNPNQAVDLAQQAYALAPSSATFGALTTALLFRLSHTMTKLDAKYQRMQASLLRKLGPAELITAAILTDPTLRAKITQQPDYLRVRELLKVTNQGYTQSWAVNEWALIQATEVKLAETIAASIRNDKRATHQEMLSDKYAATSVSSQFGNLLLKHFYGKDKEALQKMTALVSAKN
jgi:tetratricopeptide (TPR) repeat protein